VLADDYQRGTDKKVMNQEFEVKKAQEATATLKFSAVEDKPVNLKEATETKSGS
jgi:hypothetical protein